MREIDSFLFDDEDDMSDLCNLIGCETASAILCCECDKRKDCMIYKVVEKLAKQEKQIEELNGNNISDYEKSKKEVIDGINEIQKQYIDYSENKVEKEDFEDNHILELEIGNNGEIKYIWLEFLGDEFPNRFCDFETDGKSIKRAMKKLQKKYKKLYKEKLRELKK